MNKSELKSLKERYFSMSKRIASLTEKSLIKETETEKQARIAHLLKPENYNQFFDYYFGTHSGFALADAPCADFHLSSYLKVWKDPFIVQFRRWYRGAAKSIHTNVGNILHLKQNNQLNFAAIVGRSESRAKILLQDLQVHLEHNKLFLSDFGTQLKYGSWADGQFETADNKNFIALGINQPFRGLRFGANRIDFASVDDVEDRDQAKNKDMIRKYGERIISDLGQAFHLRRGRMIIPNNHIVKDGINDFILSKKKDSPHLHLSTINLANAQGNPSWYQRLSKEDVARIHADVDPFTLAREYYNNPIEEGKLFKATQLVNRAVHGNETWDGFLVHWDLSYTSNGDYKAGALIGIQGLRITVLEVFCQRCSINSAMERHFGWIAKYKLKGYTPLSFYDATAAQLAVYSPVITQCAEDNKAFDLPIPMHQQGDKHNRIEATLTNVLHRKILFWDKNLENDNSKDYQEFINQILSFEKGTNNEDDAPDTLERAISLAQLYYGYSTDSKSTKPLIGKKSTKRKRI